MPSHFSIVELCLFNSSHLVIETVEGANSIKNIYWNKTDKFTRWNHIKRELNIQFMLTIKIKF